MIMNVCLLHSRILVTRMYKFITNCPKGIKAWIFNHFSNMFLTVFNVLVSTVCCSLHHVQILYHQRLGSPSRTFLRSPVISSVLWHSYAYQTLHLNVKMCIPLCPSYSQRHGRVAPTSFAVGPGIDSRPGDQVYLLVSCGFPLSIQTNV
jgi:hypothetical protein